jgi:glycosyltransferase involved in cell wall biosynthesis
MPNSLNILYTGRYYDTAPRGLTLRQGLRAQGAKVYEVHIDHETRQPWKRKLRRKLDNFKKSVDVVICADLSQLVIEPVIEFAREREIPLVLDFFFSFYESMVFDRKVLSKHSWRAAFYRKSDLRALKEADLVFFDTADHLVFTADLYPDSFRRAFVLPIGCPELFFEEKPGEVLEKTGIFNVLFWGSYIPLQGVEYILKAAHDLQDKDPEIHFSLIGKEGQTYPQMKQMAKDWQLNNLEFIPAMSPEKLIGHIRSSDIALGIFGDTGKAQRVVPHKVYEAMALGLPIITMASSASEDLLSSQSCCLSAPEKLSENILYLKNHPEIRAMLGKAARRLAEANFHPHILGKYFLDELLKISKKNLRK